MEQDRNALVINRQLLQLVSRYSSHPEEALMGELAMLMAHHMNQQLVRDGSSTSCSQPGSARLTHACMRRTFGPVQLSCSIVTLPPCIPLFCAERACGTACCTPAQPPLESGWPRRPASAWACTSPPPAYPRR